MVERHRLEGLVRKRCPYGQVGDRLWVRESFGYLIDGGIAYRANCDSWHLKHGLTIPWKPSIHMFRKDSRITLEITGVRVERLQEITEEDAQSEGIKQLHFTTGMKVNCMPQFIELWDSLNAKRGYGWEVNPWVWVIGFKVIK